MLSLFLSPTLSLHTAVCKRVRLSRCGSISFLSNREHLCSANAPFAQTHCCWFPAKPQNQSALRQHGPQFVDRPKASVQVLNRSATFYYMWKALRPNENKKAHIRQGKATYTKQWVWIWISPPLGWFFPLPAENIDPPRQNVTERWIWRRRGRGIGKSFPDVDESGVTPANH